MKLEFGLLYLLAGVFGVEWDLNGFSPDLTQQIWTADCPAQQDCDSCYSHSSLCHWCSDEHGNVSTGGCFARFTGCQIGASCAGDDCGERRTCSACSMGGCKWCGGVSEPPCAAMYSWKCALPAKCMPNSECIRPVPEYLGYSPVPTFLLVPMIASFLVSLVSLVRRRFKLAFSLLFLGVGLLGGCVVKQGLLEVSVCNAQMMWRDSLISLATKGTVNMEILISVYSPNWLLSVKVKAIDGLLNYRKLFPVGNFRLANFTATHGHVTDQLGVLEISTSAEYVAQMVYDFNVAHSLIFSVDPLVVEFESITLFGRWSFPVVMRLPPVLVDANKPPLQRLCHCHQTALPLALTVDA